MVQFAAKFLVSLLITNWLYAESMLLFPDLQEFGDRIIAKFQIPTHDKWSEIADSTASDELLLEIENWVANNASHVSLPINSLVGKDVVDRWKERKQPLVRNVRSFTPQLDVDYLKDLDIFSAPNSSGMRFYIPVRTSAIPGAVQRRS